MPATTGTAAAITRARIAPSASRVGSYDTRNERRSRNNPRVRARRPMIQKALVACPYSGRGCARSAARPSPGRTAANGGDHSAPAAQTPPPFMCPAPSGYLDHRLGSLEQRLATCRDEILIEERDRVVAGVALSPHKPCAGVDGQPLGRDRK